MELVSKISENIQSIPILEFTPEEKKLFEHSLIKKLNLNEYEKNKFGVIIRNIIANYEQCKENPSKICKNPDGYHDILVRKDGELKVISIICEKNVDVIKLKKNYLFHDFADSDFAIRLNKYFFDSSTTPEKNMVIGVLSKMIKEGINNGIYIYGAFGSGKTYVMTAFCNEMILRKNKTVAFVPVSTFVSAYSSGKFGDDSKKRNEIIDKIKTADIFVFDDIGQCPEEKTTYSQYFFAILEFRFRNKLPTFFTSNYDLTSLENELNKKTFKNKLDTSRLMERIYGCTKKEVYKIVDTKNWRYE